MKQVTIKEEDKSPFHIGEQEIQTRTGKREAMESFGRRAIRPFMPDQHREFYTQLPFLVLGSVDNNGWPWASILTGKQGFTTSPDEKTLQINASAEAGDPLGQSIKAGAPLGLLGIGLDSRRRNRMNGRISTTQDEGFTLTVDQSFGNCPQYIQTRDINYVREPGSKNKGAEIIELTSLGDNATQMIRDADTFFVSSFVQTKDNPIMEGVDVSHRGGKPGFVKVEGNTLTIPDYPGNYHFNTLGNFLLNPKAGMVFTDFETGDILTLTGTVELLWEDEPEVTSYKGAQRAWRFNLDHGFLLKGGLPFRAKLQEFSPNSLLADNWQDVEDRKALEEKRNAWRPFRLAKVEDESSVIRSFYLEADDGEALLPFEAGQFLTIRVTPEGADKPAIRTYTVSSAPADCHYRISVKREEHGVVSRHLHDVLKEGDIIEVKAPSGDFFIDASETRPAVLIAGGVGITPMISMARHVAIEGIRTRHFRPLTVFHSAQNTDQRAFANAFEELQEKTSSDIRYYTLVDTALESEKSGVDFNGTGYITSDILRQALALDDYDFFLCGPPPFMQALYNTLRDIGVRDVRINAEAFGPAALTRRPDEGAVLEVPVEEAEEAVVKFAKSDFEQRWNKGDDTLLEVAEAHGLTPEFSCRTGNCGSCAVKLKAGKVAYRTKPTATPEDDEVLICCAVPAKDSETVELDL